MTLIQKPMFGPGKEEQRHQEKIMARDLTKLAGGGGANPVANPETPAPRRDEEAPAARKPVEASEPQPARRPRTPVDGTPRGVVTRPAVDVDDGNDDDDDEVPQRGSGESGSAPRRDDRPARRDDRGDRSGPRDDQRPRRDDRPARRDDRGDRSGPRDDQRPRRDDPPVEQPIWYVLLEGVQQGPHTVAKIREDLARGVYKCDALVWRNGLDGWKVLNTLPDLKDALPPAQPPPPPQPHVALPPQAAAHPPVAQRRCGHCSEIYRVGAGRCGNCGNPLPQ